MDKDLKGKELGIGIGQREINFMLDGIPTNMVSVFKKFFLNSKIFNACTKAYICD